MVIVIPLKLVVVVSNYNTYQKKFITFKIQEKKIKSSEAYDDIYSLIKNQNIIIIHYIIISLLSYSYSVT